MKYSCFEELPVWRAAIDFALHVFEFTSDDYKLFLGLGDARNQLERAAISISNNVAEGFERGSTSELIQFLYIAKGSAGESRSVLHMCRRAPKFTQNVPRIDELIGRATGISRQLNGWIEALKRSDIKGPKYRRTASTPDST